MEDQNTLQSNSSVESKKRKRQSSEETSEDIGEISPPPTKIQRVSNQDCSQENSIIDDNHRKLVDIFNVFVKGDNNNEQEMAARILEELILQNNKWGLDILNVFAKSEDKESIIAGWTLENLIDKNNLWAKEKFTELLQSDNTNENYVASLVLRNLIHRENQWGKDKLTTLAESDKSQENHIAARVLVELIFQGNQWAKNTLVRFILNHNIQIKTKDEGHLLAQLIKGALLLKAREEQNLFSMREVFDFLRNIQQTEQGNINLNNILADIFDRKEAWEQFYGLFYNYLADNSSDRTLSKILSTVKWLPSCEVSLIAKIESQYNLKRHLDIKQFSDTDFIF